MADLSFDDTKVSAVLARVTGSGGLPLTDYHQRRMLSWYRTLFKRGLTKVDLILDFEKVSAGYKRAFPNANTRAQHIRGFLAYVSGLNQDEFSAEFPGTDRRSVVETMRKVNSEAIKESRAAKAEGE